MIKNIKQQLYAYCINNMDERLMHCDLQAKQLLESLSSETKSSAGDKHETGRAMIQLEREQMGLQLKQLENEKSILEKINPSLQAEKVQIGSVVFTNAHNYYIATSIGKIVVDGIAYFALSTHSPIGQLFLGKMAGDTIRFREKHIEILKVI